MNSLPLPDVPAPFDKWRVVVVGGGISGLTVMHSLLQSDAAQRHEIEAVLLEGRPTCGGVIRTVNVSGAIVDLGPECFMTTKPAALRLAEDLGLGDRIVASQCSAGTQIVHNDKLYDLPADMLMFAPARLAAMVSCGLLSWPGKLRMVLELLVNARRDERDESVAQFVRRRFGSEVLERLAEPYIGGIYGTEPESLSVQAALPQMVDLEKKHGSVVRGLLKEGMTALGEKTSSTGTTRIRPFAERGHMASFDKGMGLLIEKLEESVDRRRIMKGRQVLSVERGEHGRRWDVYCIDGSLIPADAVIVAVPAREASQLLVQTDQGLSVQLQLIGCKSPVLVTMLFARSEVSHRLDRSGFLIPRGQRRSLRAVTFSSNKFPGRAPSDKVLLKAALDLTGKPELSGLSDTELTGAVLEDLHVYLGITAEPAMAMVIRHHNAIAHYAPGHADLCQSIDKRLESLPGLGLAGNAYKGVGIADCIKRAQEEADRTLRGLKAKSSSP